MGNNAEGRNPIQASELVDFARYCVRAVSRHRKLALTLWLVALVLSAVAALAMPKKWSVNVRILTKRSYIIPSLVSPHRAVPLDSDRPTRGAVEMIQSHEFREELLEVTNLPALAERHLTRFQRMESAFYEAIGGKAPPDKIRAGLIQILGKAIDARVVDDGVLSIVVSWGHPAVAHTLAEQAIELFLRKQKAAQLDEIHDTVDIIRRNVLRAHSRLTETSTRLSDLIKRKETDLTQRLTVRETRERRTVSFRRPASVPALENERDDRRSIAQHIRERERELRRLTDQHAQRLARAERNLERLEESLGPRHPDLQAAMREVEEARPTPVEITTLKTEIAGLQGRIATATTGATDAGVARFEVVQMPLSEDVYNAMQADPEVGHMMEEVRKYATEYAEQLDRLEAAELEIEMTNAAFAYRYNVTQPPIFPTRPAASKRKLVMAVGLMLGFLITLLACVVLDLLSGRIRARWQVERLIGARVLGTVRMEE